MNWYKKAKLQGEWWLVNGNATFADADVGDYNHSEVVIETILAQHDLDETTDLSEENPYSLKQKGLSDIEIKVVYDQVDPRAYAMNHWGWKRVCRNNVQTQTLTPSDLEDVANGLWEINEDIKDDEEINIEVMNNRTYYSSVPYNIINSKNTEQLIPYRKKY